MTAAQGTAEYVSMAYWRIGYPDAGYLDAGTHCCEVEPEAAGSNPVPAIQTDTFDIVNSFLGLQAIIGLGFFSLTDARR